jgi:hypothetical protein
MTVLNNIKGKLAKSVLWFLIFIQTIMLSALGSIGFSREHYDSLSSSLYPESAQLFNSAVMDILATPISGIVLLFIIGIVILKEFFVSKLSHRFIVNLVGCTSLSIFSGLIFKIIYMPVI